MRARLPILVAVLALAGCADDSDLSESPPTETPPGEDSTPAEETSSDDSTAPDTAEDDGSLPDTSVDETSSPDTFVADTFVADTFVADTFVADTLVADTFKPDTFVADTAPADTCVRNACGGCTVLTGTVGAACGTCGGKLACSGTDSLACSGSMPLNACGGCTVLANAPGAACGTCGTSKYICAADKNSTSCEKPADTNACGGCTALTPALGTVCGVCSTGTTVCNGTTATRCSDPVTSPAPGTACGICGTYACATGGMSTTCNETATVQSDLTYASTATTVGVYDNTVAFAYPVRHKGRIVSVSLRVARQFIAFGPPPVPWTLTIEVLRGTPTAPGASLGSVTYDVASMPSIPVYSASAAPAASTTFALPTTVTLNVGDPIFFRITRVSVNNLFHFYGSAGAGPADLTAHDQASTTAPWTVTTFDPHIDVKMNGCF